MTTQKKTVTGEGKAPRNFRIKLTAHMCDNRYYLSRRDGVILLQGVSGMANCLSNISQNAAEFLLSSRA